MSVKLNLGAWSSVFAVPSKIVDEGLKFSDGVKLKVLLYVLRNSEKMLSDEEISKGTGVNVTDVPEALDYWVSFGVLDKADNDYILAENNNSVYDTVKSSLEQSNSDLPAVSNTTSENTNINSTVQDSSVSQPMKFTPDNVNNDILPEKSKPEQSKQKLTVSRLQRPDYVFTAQRLAVDEELKILVNEAQISLGKTLGNTDISVLLMLKDTCGLPLDVLFMLIQYCISIDKPNIHTIEKIGLEWANDGIYSLEAAEQKIASVQQTSRNFSIVSSTFGLKNAGSPSEKQRKFADEWVGNWKFSPEMLRVAYERCIDKHSTINWNYINGILNNWNTNNIRNIDDLKASEASNSKTLKDKQSGTSIDYEKLNKITVPDFD